MVDQDAGSRRHIQEVLAGAGFSPVAAANPHEAERIMESDQPHLVLTALDLPWSDGFELMERVRRTCAGAIPVIVVAGYGADRDMERALRVGGRRLPGQAAATHRAGGPVQGSTEETRPRGREESQGTFVLGELAINYAGRAVTVAGKRVKLTATEYLLLTELSAARGRVPTHDQLLRNVWGPLHYGDARNVRTHIKTLRGKLGDDARDPSYILTEIGVGYRMARPQGSRNCA